MITKSVAFIVPLFLYSCTSIYYEKPQPVFGLQINKIPSEFHGEFYKKNNQIRIDQNNIADSFFYYHPKLTIGPTSIHWFKNLDRTKEEVYDLNSDTNRSLVLITKDYIVFNLYNDFGASGGYQAIFSNRNLKDSTLLFYTGFPGTKRMQRKAWQNNYHLDEYSVLTNQMLHNKDLKRLERTSLPVLALTKSKIQNSLLEEDDLVQQKAKPKRGLDISNYQEVRRNTKINRLTDRYAKKCIEEPTYVIFYEIFQGENYAGSGVAVLDKYFKHEDYQDYFAQLIENSFKEFSGVFDFQTEECTLLPYKNCEQLQLSRGQINKLEEEDLERLKINLKFQRGNMHLPSFWQDPIQFANLSSKQAKQKLKILINELD